MNRVNLYLFVCGSFHADLCFLVQSKVKIEIVGIRL